jgi:hypothetical protein
MLVEQGMGGTVIAQRLNAEGVPTFKGGKMWHGTTINKIVRSIAPLGDYQPCFGDGRPDGAPAYGYFGPPVIAPDLYHRAQAILDSNKKKPGRRPSGDEVRNLLVTKVKCAACGGIMNCHRRDKDRVDVYQCYAMTLHKCDNRVRYKVKEVEEFVISAVTEFELTERVDASGAEQALSLARGEQAEIERHIGALLDQMEDPSNLGNRLISERLAKRSAQLGEKEAEVETLRLALQRLRTAAPMEDRQDQIRALRKRLGTLEGKELYDLRSRLGVALRSVIELVTFHEKGIIAVRSQGREMLRTYVPIAGGKVGTLNWADAETRLSA